MALGAWRRLAAGERSFAPQMWSAIGELITEPADGPPCGADAEVRELSDEEAWDVVQRSLILHANLATGRFRYIDERQNIHAPRWRNVSG